MQDRPTETPAPSGFRIDVQWIGVAGEPVDQRRARIDGEFGAHVQLPFRDYRGRVRRGRPTEAAVAAEEQGLPKRAVKHTAPRVANLALQRDHGAPPGAAIRYQRHPS